MNTTSISRPADSLDLKIEAINATSISRNDIMEGNASDSDSDAHSNGIPEFYQPITAIDDANDDEDSDEANSENLIFDRQILSNGHDLRAEDGMRSLNLSDDETDSEREEEEVRMRAKSAITAAFREDESRRNAPLTTKNASRVREVMRGVSFAGFAPDWASRVPEEQLIHQKLRK